MKIDEHGNAVPGPTSIMPSQALAQSYSSRFDDEEDDLDVLEPMQNEPENF
jgi:DNA-directed RNA polymerase subunit alpha